MSSGGPMAARSVPALPNRQGRSARHIRNRALQGRYPDQRDAGRALYLAERIPASQARLHPGGPLQRGQWAAGHSARRHRRGRDQEQFCPGPVPHLTRRHLVRTLTHRAPQQEERPAVIVNAAASHAATARQRGSSSCPGPLITCANDSNGPARHAQRLAKLSARWFGSARSPARRRTAVARHPELVITERRRARDGRLPCGGDLAC